MRASAKELGTRGKTTYLSPGIETGLTWHYGGEGFGTTLGLRMSLNDVGQHFSVPVAWRGVYGRVLRDFKTESWRTAFGYGVGVLFLGLEAGVAVHVDDQTTKLGAEAAMLGTIGHVGIHVRHTQFFDRPAVTEIGLRGSWPIKIQNRTKK
jgi:hypothetical protein